MTERKRAKSARATQAAVAKSELTVEDVMARAALVGVEVDADQWETLTMAMNQSLATLAALRPSEQRQVEPAVRFEP